MQLCIRSFCGCLNCFCFPFNVRLLLFPVYVRRELCFHSGSLKVEGWVAHGRNCKDSLTSFLSLSSQHLSIAGGSSGSSRRFQFSTAVVQKVERQMGSLECLQQSIDPSHGQQVRPSGCIHVRETCLFWLLWCVWVSKEGFYFVDLCMYVLICWSFRIWIFVTQLMFAYLQYGFHVCGTCP